MSENDERDFDKEIEELKIQQLISEKPSYDDVKAYTSQTKEAYDDEIREQCRLKLVDIQVKEMSDKQNAVIYEKSTVFGLRKYMERELREQKEGQNVIKRLLEDILEKKETSNGG